MVQRLDPGTELRGFSNAGPCAAAGDSMMQLRVARHTERLDELVRCYRDGIGLTEIGGFHDHDGYDGVFVAIPGTSAHLELTSGGGRGGPVPHPESLLLYHGDDEQVQTVAARLGADLTPPANPYWTEHGLRSRTGWLPRGPRP